MEDNKGITDDDIREDLGEDNEKYLHLCVNSVMAQKTGRHLIWHLLSDFKVYNDPFNENPIILSRNVGIMGAGLKLLKLILSECPDKYEVMFAEHKYIEEE